MKRVYRKDVQPIIGGIGVIPDEVVALILCFAYPPMKYDNRWVSNVTRLRETCVQLCRVIDRHIFTTIKSLSWVVPSTDKDTSISLFPALQTIHSNIPVNDKKKGTVILGNLCKLEEALFFDRVPTVMPKEKGVGSFGIVLRQLPLLTTLVVGCVNIPIPSVEACPLLEKLIFTSACALSTRHIMWLPGVKCMSLCDCSFDNEFDTSLFTSLRNLESLSISEKCVRGVGQIGVFSVSTVRELTCLKHLSLYETGSFDGPSIAVMGQLETLCIQERRRISPGNERHPIKDTHLALLGKLRRVTFIDMNHLTLESLRGSSDVLESLVYNPRRGCDFFHHMSFDELIERLVHHFPLLDTIQFSSSSILLAKSDWHLEQIQERVLEKRRLLVGQ